MSIAVAYKGKSQDEIMRAVIELSKDIVSIRSKGGWLAAERRQRLRQQRAELQTLLTKPHVVWG